MLDESSDFLLAAVGARAFAKDQALELVPANYFFTEGKWNSLQERLKLETPHDRTTRPRT